MAARSSGSKGGTASSTAGAGQSRVTFTVFVALPSVIVYVGVCVLVLLSLSLMTSEINRIDGDRGRKAVSAALNSFVTSLGESVADEATWTEAYINTYVSFNPAWLDGTWGSTARTSDNYDTAIVTDAKKTGLDPALLAGSDELWANLKTSLKTEMPLDLIQRLALLAR